MKKILVTGCNGNLASSFIKKYHKQFNFLGIDKQKKTNLKIKKYINKDILKIKKILTNQKLVLLHFSGYTRTSQCETDPIGCIKNNILAPIHLLNIINSKKIKSIIYTHSYQSIYDKNEMLKTIYGDSKSFLENYLIKFCVKNKIKLRIVYLPDIFFEKINSKKFFEEAFGKLKKNKKIIIEKNSTLNFVKSENLIYFFFKLIENDLKNNIISYIIKPDLSITLRNYIKKLKIFTSSNSTIYYKKNKNYKYKIYRQKISFNKKYSINELLKIKFTKQV